MNTVLSPDCETTSTALEVSSEELRDAFHAVANNKRPGIDGITKEMFALDFEAKLELLREELAEGTYKPQPVLRGFRKKPGGGQRPIAYVSTVDKIVQRVVLQRITPSIERMFFDRSAARSGGGIVAAADQLFVDIVEHQPDEVICLDFEQFFETLEHDTLLGWLRPLVPAAELALIRNMVRCVVATPLAVAPAAGDAEGADDTERAAGDAAVPATKMSEAERVVGIEQGMPISMLLANLYMHYALDVWLDEHDDVSGWTRFLDDIVVVVKPGPPRAESLLAAIAAHVEGSGLRLNSDKTNIVTDFATRSVMTLETGGMDPFRGLVFVGTGFRPARTRAGSYFMETYPQKSATEQDRDEAGGE